jgi:hypothetical protein
MLGGTEVAMRAAGLFTLLVSLAVAPMLAQKPADDPKTRLPAKGDRVIVRGCVGDSTLNAAVTRREEGDGSLETAVTYRLTGNRKLTRALREEHKGELVEVKGVLKSELPDEATAAPGRTIGRSGIRIGIGAPPRGNSPGDMMPHYPVLEVTSFERVTGRCQP